MKNAGGVYEIRNTLNNHIYIGSSINLKHRFTGHVRSLGRDTHKNRYLQRAWNKYKPSSFQFNILFYCDKEMCVYFEQRCIDALDPEYNICKIAGSSLGVKYTQETKDKLSAMRIGNQNARGRAGKKYQPHSAETKAKISAALMGNKNSLGCIRTAETRKKLSKLLKGRKFTKAHLANMSLGQKRRRSACIGKTEDC